MVADVLVIMGGIETIASAMTGAGLLLPGMATIATASAYADYFACQYAKIR
jgi:hypothetical protein